MRSIQQQSENQANTDPLNYEAIFPNSLSLIAKICGRNWLQLFIVISFVLSSCGLDVEDSTPPSPPQWMAKSLPEVWPEHGIDANESGDIYLEWVPNPLEEDVDEYEIYRATYYSVNDSLGDFELLATYMTASDSVCQYTDQNAVTNVKYLFKIKAVDSSDNTSELSEAMMYTLLPALNYAAMSPNGLSSPLPISRNLSWDFAYTASLEDYCITILDFEDILIKRIAFNPGNYTGGGDSWTIPADVVLIPDRVYKWRLDTGAQYIDGLETAGSESTWATFLYTGQ